jgi:2-haloacid dehalogenase
MPAIDTVIFDIGNVLIEWEPRHLYRKLFAEESRMEWFLANICTGAWNLEQDRGRSFAEGVRELTLRHPEWVSEIRAYDERWGEMVPGEVPGSVAILDKLLGRHLPIFGISNFSTEKFAYARERFGFLDRLNGVVVSGHEGLLKPDAAIYRLFLERYGRQARRCLFIDDSPANVEGARKIGMNAAWFQDAPQLERELVTFGLL